jgi:hypothetical protein
MMTEMSFRPRRTRPKALIGVARGTVRLEYRTPGGCLKVYYGDNGDDYVYTEPCGIKKEHVGPCGPGPKPFYNSTHLGYVHHHLERL